MSKRTSKCNISYRERGASMVEYMFVANFFALGLLVATQAITQPAGQTFVDAAVAMSIDQTPTIFSMEGGGTIQTED